MPLRLFLFHTRFVVTGLGLLGWADDFSFSSGCHCGYTRLMGRGFCKGGGEPA